MKKKALSGTATYWLVIPKGKEWTEDGKAFVRREQAEHFIDHRTEGWDGWKLLQVSAFAEHHP